MDVGRPLAPLQMGIISPQEWGLPVANVATLPPIPDLGLPLIEIDQRLHGNIYEWLPRQRDVEADAFYGFYRATDGYREPPQTVNLIISWQLMAVYDRFADARLLEWAEKALDFYYRRFVVSHPMSVVAGGACDGVATREVWTKFSAEFVIGALGFYRRTGREVWLERAQQSGRYLLQAARHGFAPKYHLDAGRWEGLGAGWDSWGRVVEACLDLARATNEVSWQDLALRWGEHGLSAQAEDGCFYLIDQEYYNTDLAADELRGLTLLYELTQDERFLRAARRFADWHLAHQRSDGAWIMTVDRDGNVVVPTVGPGDVPNIAMALLRLHYVTAEACYLEAALRAFKYALSKQVLPGSDQPYANDPNVQWGFWSWDPHYDYTVSGDQATHHVRGMMFVLDYWGALWMRRRSSLTP